MPKRRYDQKKVIRYAAWGGGILGLLGFVAGIGICLHYSLPIPPVFITEIGLLVGGSLGALTAYYGVERRVVPTFVSLAVVAPTCYFLGLSWPISLAVLGFVVAVAWTLPDSDHTDGQSWKTI